MDNCMWLKTALTRVFSHLGHSVRLYVTPIEDGGRVEVSISWVPWEEATEDITEDLLLSGMVVDDSYRYFRVRSTADKRQTVTMGIDVDNPRPFIEGMTSHLVKGVLESTREAFHAR